MQFNLIGMEESDMIAIILFNVGYCYMMTHERETGIRRYLFMQGCSSSLYTLFHFLIDSLIIFLQLIIIYGFSIISFLINKFG
jgi:hypothetical protein